jgi:DNA polymerase-3 subunit gamma/tau
MKIAGLGQKKNDVTPEPTFATDFSLPPLEVAPTQVVQATPTQAAQPQPQQSAPQPQAPSTAPTQQSVAPQTKVEVEEPREERQGDTTAEAAPRRAQRPTRATKASVSISNLLSGDAKTASEMVAEELAAAATVNIDPHCEEKLTVARDKIIDELIRTKRRTGIIFQSMTVEGNVITITVPSREWHDDIMRDKIDLQKQIADISGVKGIIEISVIVNEHIKAARPITLEDRLKHLINKNERLTEMIERLSLDAE